MDALASTEFRKRFARLTEPTLVTVNGHVIGEWRPAGAAEAPRPTLDPFAYAARFAEEATAELRRSEFRPVPKPAPKVRKGR